MTLAALGGQDVAVGERHLIGMWQNGAVEEDVLDADGEAVARDGGDGLDVRVAVEEVLGANVPKTVGELPSSGEDGIEGVEMGLNGGGEGRVGGRVGGRVLEQVLSALRAEGRAPWLRGRRGLRRSGRHSGEAVRIMQAQLSGDYAGAWGVNGGGRVGGVNGAGSSSSTFFFGTNPGSTGAYCHVPM